MSPKVLIIGGGLSGLALGQVLRRNKIDFEIFERDHDSHSRTQGWAISLRECLAGIYKLFPDDMPPLEESVSVFKNLDQKLADSVGADGKLLKANFGAVHFETGESIEKIYASGKEDLAHHWMRANRASFRNWLSHNLAVNWGKRFVRYEEDESGVRAYFEDGSVAEGDILIAADGASSRARVQLLGEELAKEHIAPLGAISADVTLDEAQCRDFLQKGSAFFTSNNPRYHFFVGVRDFNHDPVRTGEYYWSVTWDDQPASEGQQQQQQQQQQQTDGGTSTSVPKPPEYPKEGEAARQYALERCSDLHPSLRSFISSTKPSQITDTAPTLRQWAPEGRRSRLGGRRVTLMGDALHTMTPFKGAGANTAMLDAFDIAQLLLQAGAAGKGFADIVPLYEEVAVPRGRATMMFSRSAGLSHDPLHWSRIMRRVYDAGYEWQEIGQKM